MTYSELLHQVSFEDIIPYLNGEDNAHLYGYKQHYDMLRQMEPVAAGVDYKGFREIKIERSSEEKGGELMTLCLDCEPWYYSLAKEIVLDDGVEASPAEIAACCLWWSSYYGFVKDYIEDVPTYDRMWWGTYHRDPLFDKFVKLYGTYFRPSWVRKRKDYKDNLKMRMRKLDEINAIGSKRHFWKRACMRNAYRDVVTSLCAFVNYVCQGNNVVTPPSAKVLCETLFKSHLCAVNTLWAFSGCGEKRIAYLQDLVEEYGALDGAQVANVILCVTTSAEHPLTTNEQVAIASLFGDGYTNIIWCVKTDEHMKEELRIDYAFYE